MSGSSVDRPHTRLHDPVMVVASPHAGQSRRLSEALERLRAAGVEIAEQIDVHALNAMDYQGDAWRVAGYRAVIAAGGDGTLGTVASHLAGTDIPLGVLPLGTSNDTARALGVSMALPIAVETLVACATIPVDAGQAIPTADGDLGDSDGARLTPLARRPTESAPLARSAYFLHALTLGFNAQFARLATDIEQRERFGPFTYATSLLQALSGFAPIEASIHFRGGGGRPDAMPDISVETRVLLIAIVNSPWLGGAMRMRIPGVSMHDGLLDFFVFESFEPGMLQETLASLLAHRAASSREGQGASPTDARHLVAMEQVWPGVTHYRARSALLTTPTPVDVTLDGELGAQTPVLVRAAPDPVFIIVPQATYDAFSAQENGTATHAIWTQAPPAAGD